PLWPRPTADRTASAMTISMGFLGSVPERLVVLKHVLHARLRQRLSAQADERLALELEDLVLGDGVRCARAAAAQNVGELHRDLGVVRARISAIDQRIDQHVERGNPTVAGQLVGARRGRVIARVGQADRALLGLPQLARAVERYAVALAE